MLKTKYRVFRRMKILSKVASPYVVRCHELYSNQSYSAVAYELVDCTLKDQLLKDPGLFDKYKVILRHVFQGMDAIRQSGVMVRHLKLENVFFKFGVCKIGDFPLFKSEQMKNMTMDDEGGDEDIENSSSNWRKLRIDDVWAFGIFFVYLLLTKTQATDSEELLRNFDGKCAYSGILET
jgi:serine/threonine protein kinase